MMLANPLALVLLVPIAVLLVFARRKTSRFTPLLELPQIRRGRLAGGRARFDQNDQPASRLPWRLALAAMLLVLALARPQWGTEPSASKTGEILVALDLSQSMLAADVAPSRLERARIAARSLVETMPEQSFGLIGFAGEAFLFAPPSTDRSLFMAYLESAAPQHMPTQGTDFSDLLGVVGTSFSSEKVRRILVIITDAEAEPNSWQQQLSRLKLSGVRIVALAIGTPEGALVPDLKGEPILIDGQPVRTRLVLQSLSPIAADSEGVVATSTEALIAGVQAALAAPDAENLPSDAPGERFSWFLLAALVVSLAGMANELPARPVLRRAVAGSAAAAIISLTLIAGLFDTQAVAQRYRPPVLSGPEPDPLLAVKEEVLKSLSGDAVTARNYAGLAAAALRYGEVHRGHGHELSQGVLDDGLAAVAAGRVLDPDAADWSSLADRLRRLSEAPPPMPEADPDPADPANEPLEGKMALPVPDNEGQGEQDGDDKEKQADADNRRVGGDQRDVYDEAEWRDPTLVQPLTLLEAVKAEDSPAEIFGLLQPKAGKRRSGRQTW